MFTQVKEAIEHFRFYSSGVMDVAALYRIEIVIAQFTCQTARWSLELAVAFDDQDWVKVSKICGQINKTYCDLVYQKKGGNNGM